MVVIITSSDAIDASKIPFSVMSYLKKPPESPIFETDKTDISTTKWICFGKLHNCRYVYILAMPHINLAPDIDILEYLYTSIDDQDVFGYVPFCGIYVAMVSSLSKFPSSFQTQGEIQLR